MALHSAAACGLSLLALLAGCTVLQPGRVQPGQNAGEVAALAGAPTGRYALPGGAARLEYASGPFGKTTWMIDLDAAGRVTAARQVLTEAVLRELQARLDGLPKDELLRTIGRPGEVRGGGWQGGEVWSWRYATNDCLWFQVSVDDGGRTRGGIFNIDPRCDARSDARE